MGLGVKVGIRVWGLGFRVRGLGLRVPTCMAELGSTQYERVEPWLSPPVVHANKALVAA